MGSTNFFEFRKKAMYPTNFRTKKNIFSKLWGMMGLMNLKNAQESISQNLLSSRHANFLNIKFYENGTPPYLRFWTRRVLPVSKIDRWNVAQCQFYYLLLFPLLLYSFILLLWYISFLFPFLFSLFSSRFRKLVWQNNQEKHWFAVRNY